MSSESSVDTLSREALIDLAIDGWRISRLLDRLIARLDPIDAVRYAGQARYFHGRIDECLAKAQLRLVSLEGQAFDEGMAATAINLSDFEASDALVVDQMVVPIVLDQGGIVRTGSVVVALAPQR